LNTRTTAVAVVITATLSLSACSSGADNDSKPKETTSRVTATPDNKPGGLTAKQAAGKLADAIGVSDLGNPSDNTGACASKAESDGCKQLITTDMVSVYEFGTPAVSQKWVKAMKVNGDWRPVGRFALAWTARDQGLTSKERRNELESAMKKLVADE
jgi:hypothetical protein